MSSLSGRAERLYHTVPKSHDTSMMNFILLTIIAFARVLSIAGAISLVGSFNSSVYQAAGAVRRNFWITACMTPVVIVLVSAASLIDLRTVAAAFILISVIRIYASYQLMRQIIGASVWDVLRAAWKSFLLAILTMAPPICMVLLSGRGLASGDVELLLAVAVVAAISWIGGVFLLGHPIRNEIRMALVAGRRMLASKS
jgi:hypothetical protein